MKKIIYIFTVAVLAALSVVSCKKEQAPHEAGEPDLAGCYGVYFPSQEAAGSHTYDPSQEPVVSFTVARKVTTGDITVPVTVTASEDNIFQVGTLSFADGQKEASLTVKFPDAQEGTQYDLNLRITDPQYASTYSAANPSIDFSVMRVQWQYFLNPVTNEKALIQFDQSWWGETAYGYIKYYEVDGVRTCFTETVKHIVNGEENDNPGFWGYGEDYEWTFVWYPKVEHPSVEGATLIMLPFQPTGYVHSSLGMIYGGDEICARNFWGSNYDWMSNALKDNFTTSYYDGNGGFYFGVFAYTNEESSGWQPSDKYDTIGIAEGFTRVDFDMTLKTDFTEGGYTPVYMETGVDIVSLKYAVYEGSLNAVQVEARATAIEAGEDASETYDAFEYSEETGKNYGALAIAPEKSGEYTVVLVAYDKNGAVQNVGYITVNHICAEDVEENQVNISLFTEPTPARYTSFTEYDSFAFGIGGKGIEDAHVGIFPANKVNAAALEAVKYDESGAYQLPDYAIEAIGQEGGYYDVVSGLAPGTAYCVVVWATNGVMDTTIYDFFQTTPSPEVWETVGTVDWTDSFFGTWFQAAPVTYTVELQASQDVAGRYRLVNVYGEAFPYNEPGDWDDSRDYCLVINADDPDYVWFETFDTGCNWGYGDFILASDAGLYVDKGYDIEVVKKNAEAAGILFGKMEGNVITFPAGSILKAMAGYNNGSWYYGNKDDAYTITLNLDKEGNSAPAVRKSAQKNFSGKGVAAPSLKLPKVTFEREPKPVQVEVKNAEYKFVEKESRINANVKNYR